MPEVNGLSRKRHEVGNGRETVKQEESLVQGNVLLILLQDLHFVIVDLADGVSGLLFLFKNVFCGDTARGLGFKVHQVSENHYERDCEGVALCVCVGGGGRGGGVCGGGEECVCACGCVCVCEGCTCACVGGGRGMSICVCEWRGDKCVCKGGRRNSFNTYMIEIHCYTYPSHRKQYIIATLTIL